MESPAAAKAASPPGGETVLVVDDEPLMREVMASLLRNSGYCVLEASGGVEAQRLIGTNKEIKLLLTDYSMPEMNGLELARWFQGNHPGRKVIITTGSLWALVNQIIAHEPIAVLPKPFDGDQLGRVVRLLLEGSPLSQ